MYFLKNISNGYLCKCVFFNNLPNVRPFNNISLNSPKKN